MEVCKKLFSARHISSDSEFGVHCAICLISSKEYLVLVPLKSTTPSTTKKSLVFNRQHQSIFLEDPSSPSVLKYDSLTRESPDSVVYGIIGIVTLNNDLHLVLIQERALVATINGHSIYKLIAPVIIRVPYMLSDETIAKDVEKQKQYRRLLKILKIHLKARDLYFSYTFDISTCFMNKKLDNYRQFEPFWSQCEDRFFCNKAIISPLIERGLHEWIVPILRGIFQTFCLVLQGRRVDLFLVSRRSRFRDGTRYNTRGVNEDGDTANFVETEQILLVENRWLSFTQVRGSVPVLWEQVGKKFYPVPKIDPDFKKNAQLFSKHLSEQTKYYGPHCIVNLLSQRGIEQGLCDTYKRVAESYRGQLHYLAFDFNENYKRDASSVNQIVQILSPRLEEIGFFYQDETGTVVNVQNGIIRTNCLDCLDRTNLVQSHIGRKVTGNMLKHLQIELDYSETELLEKVLQEAWANNGDSVSLQYAGTEALKGDLTRTGKRQPSGLMKDGINSISRYYMSRFKDTARQTAIDILNGTYTEFNLGH